MTKFFLILIFIVSISCAYLVGGLQPIAAEREETTPYWQEIYEECDRDASYLARELEN